jgi:1,2-phenylacetyl-CoA epoxidase PaaB subunit
VRPYLSAVDAYVRRVEGDPLFRTVQLAAADARGQSWTVLITDDADRESVYEAARHAADGGDHALVFLTPRVLYEPGAMADVEAADERYRSFESFRRDLEALPRVTAFEVAPGDRLDALVTARRARGSA